MSIDIVPFVSVKPSKIVFYNDYMGCARSEKSLTTYKDNFKSNLTLGQISVNASQKIKTAIDWLVFMSPWKKVYSKHLGYSVRFKINFITLTLPSEQKHSDQFIKKNLLNHLLQILRYKYQVKYYVWRAEAQENGNIHFHITTNIFIPYWELMKHWNNILDKYDYIKHYSRNQKKFFANGFRVSQNPNDYRSFRQQYKAYIWNSLTGWQTPNSTDIHKVNKIQNLGAYISKYCTKQSEFRPIDGRLWYVSQALSKFQAATEVNACNLKDDLNFLCRSFKPRLKHYDYCDILHLDCKTWQKMEVPALKKLFKTYFNDIKFTQSFNI